MEEKSPIPDGISYFFIYESGKTLLIKGTPGSGKTIFALSLLNTLKGNGVYVSTGVDSDTLHLHHPWINDKLSADSILDATQPEREQIVATKEISIKPLKYTNVPDFLKGVYTRTERMENPIIIIDSWDAVASYMGFHDKKDLEEVEHKICDLSRRVGSKVILIAEYTEESALDYLVDGVIILESDMYDDRHVRRLIMQKLSGCVIKNPVALFSLNNGRFQSFAAFESEDMEIENPIIYEPLSDLSTTRLSTGIKDLDEAIKGYGKFNLFEGDYGTYDILARAIAINSLNLGKRLILTSTKQNEFITCILPYVKDEYRGNITVIEDVEGVEEIKGDTFVALINIEEPEYVDDLVKVVMSPDSGPGCGVIGFGETEKRVSFASTHIKTKFISGIPCIYGLVPRTEIYALELSKNFPVISLIPIV